MANTNTAENTVTQENTEDRRRKMIEVDDDLWREVRVLAAKRDTNPSGIVVPALREYLRNNAV